MKNIVIYLVISMMYNTMYSQSLSLFQIDAKSFPKVNGKFYAMESNGDQIIDLSPADFEITENGKPRSITLVSCPTPKPPEHLSSVLTIDISGSMCSTGLSMAKEAAKAWIEAIPLGKSECALTSFNSINYLNQDFTTDKSKLTQAVNLLSCEGGTSFDAALAEYPAGGLLVAAKGKNKRVVVLLTDGQSSANVQNILKIASQSKTIIYCVTLGTECPDLLKEIAEKTGGQWFGNITSADEAKDVYRRILKIALGVGACTIEWNSEVGCNSRRNVVLTLLRNSTYSVTNYFSPSEKSSQLEYLPGPTIKFGTIEPPDSETKNLKITAKNKSINIYSLAISNPDFQVEDWDGTPPPFEIPMDSSRTIKVKFKPSVPGYSFCRFDFEFDGCFGQYFSATTGIFDPAEGKSNLVLTFPNGGEVFVAGSDSVVTWDGIPKETTVSLEYSTNKGADWTTFTKTATDLSYKWDKIPNTPSNQCLMKVRTGSLVTKKAGDLITMLGMGNVYDIDYSPTENIIAVANGNDILLIDLDNEKIIKYLSGHTNSVNSVKFHPNGKTLISASSDKTIKLWSIKTGSNLLTYNGHTDKVNSVAFDPNGKQFVSGSEDKTIRLWNTTDAALIRTINTPTYAINDVAYHPQGRFVVAGGAYNLKIWDIKTGIVFRSMNALETVNSVAYSPDGKKILSNSNINVNVWDANSGNKIGFIGGKNYDLSVVGFSHNGQMIITADIKGNVHLWNAATYESLNIGFTQIGNIKSAIFTPDDKQIISGFAKSVSVWNIDSLKEIQSYSGHTEMINSVAYSPVNNYFASGGNDGYVVIWDAQSLTSVHYIKAHSDWVNSIEFSPDGSRIASGSSDNTIKIWEIKTKTLLKTLTGHVSEVLSVVYSPDGKMIASGSIDNTIKIWDANTGAEIKTLPGHAAAVYSIAFSPDMKKLASTGGDQIIKIWDIKTGLELKKFAGHTSAIKSIAFSPDSKRLISGSIDKTVKIWDASTGAEFMTLIGHKSGISSVAFSPDSRLIASGSYDYSIILWDAYNGSLLHTLIGHTYLVNSVAFSPDGAYLISGSSDRRVGVWSLKDMINDQGITDESDSVWSIVVPNPSAIDVNIGRVLTGHVKDSIVTGFIKNEGSWKFRVDSIYFRGPDATAFSLTSGLPVYTLDSGETHYAEFHFAPKINKIYQAEIVIITQTDTLIKNITGEGVEDQIKIADKLIDFGRVYIGFKKDTTVNAIIENIGSTPLSISNVEKTGPDNKQFSIIEGDGAFTINPGDKKEMKIRFSAQDLGRTSGGLAFHYSGFGSPAVVRLFAEGYKYIPKITSNSPICIGHDLLLYTEGIPNAEYHWSGPNGFTSNQQNVVIKKAQSSQAGKYMVYATIGEITSDTSFINVEIETMLVSPGDSSYIFVQSAKKEDGILILNQAKVWNGGAVWLKNRFSIKQDFSTTFQFKIEYGNNNGSNESSIPGADGFAFIFQNHIYPVLGEKGGDMGYEGISNSLAVEFDLYRNEYDPSGNHIAVQSMRTLENTADHEIPGSTLGLTEDIIEIRNNIIYYVKIMYQWNSKELYIYLDSTGKFEKPSLIIGNINLPVYLNLTEDEYVFIGITAATGLAFQQHDIFNWIIPCSNQYIDVNYNPEKSINTNLFVYPNPLNGMTSISYNMIKPGSVSITITDILGIEVAVLTDNKYQESGNYIINYEAKSLMPGIYYCTLKSSEYYQTVKMVVIK